MRWILAVWFTMTSAVLVPAQDKAGSTKADVASVEQSLMQIERDWNRALLTKDYKTLDRIMADDWTGIDFRGMTVTKADSISELKTGDSSNQSVELGEMKVKVWGDTAVVMGSDTEKSTYHGKDSSGQYAWMD